jgi:hypothetical protein
VSRPYSLFHAPWRSGVLTIAFVAVCVSAHAQTPKPAPRPAPTGPTPRAGSFEIGGGVTFAGGFGLGDSAAQLTRNTTTGSTAFDLFGTDSELGPGFGVGGRLGYYLSPRLTIEGGVNWSRPVLTIDLTGDTEGAPNTEAEETIDRWIIDGTVVWHFSQPRPGRAPSPLVPFVYGGVGYLRELHEGQEFVETGIVYEAGGGVKYWFGNARRRFGMRGDAGISVRDGGFDFEDGIRTVPVFSGSIIYLF